MDKIKIQEIIDDFKKDLGLVRPHISVNCYDTFSIRLRNLEAELVKDTSCGDGEVLKDLNRIARELGYSTPIQAFTALSRLRAKSKDTSCGDVLECNWDYLEDEEYYETDCGQTFYCLDDCTPEGSGFKYCIYCGKKLIVIKETT